LPDIAVRIPDLPGIELVVGWAAGDRELACMVVATNGQKLTQTVAGH
jgi:hypothetical protein